MKSRERILAEVTITSALCKLYPNSTWDWDNPRVKDNTYYGIITGGEMKGYLLKYSAKNGLTIHFPCGEKYNYLMPCQIISLVNFDKFLKSTHCSCGCYLENVERYKSY